MIGYSQERAGRRSTGQITCIPSWRMSANIGWKLLNVGEHWAKLGELWLFINKQSRSYRYVWILLSNVGKCWRRLATHGEQWRMLATIGRRLANVGNNRSKFSGFTVEDYWHKHSNGIVQQGMIVCDTCKRQYYRTLVHAHPCSPFIFTQLMQHCAAVVLHYSRILPNFACTLTLTQFMLRVN